MDFTFDTSLGDYLKGGDLARLIIIIHSTKAAVINPTVETAVCRHPSLYLSWPSGKLLICFRNFSTGTNFHSCLFVSFPHCPVWLAAPLPFPLNLSSGASPSPAVMLCPSSFRVWTRTKPAVGSHHPNDPRPSNTRPAL